MTIREIRKKYRTKIDALDLELIIAHGIGKTREFVLAHPEFIIPGARNSQLATFIKRRVKHEPIAYILGQKEFFGLNFKVDRDVLVPRPETETLVEEALALKPKNSTVIDVGTGSGNIIISLIKNLKNKNSFVAIDISAKALTIAKQNAKIHETFRKIKFIESNMLDYFLKHPASIKKDCVVIANLPYLDLGRKNLLKSSENKGLKFEPQIALYAGKDGLAVYRQFAEQLKKIKSVTKKKIAVFCEIGHVQKREMKKIFSFAKKTDFKKDLAGRWRIARIVV